MNERDLQEQLRQRTGEAMVRSFWREAALHRQQTGSPRAGDVYLLHENVDSPVEWVVLEQDPAAAGRWIVVPADTNPMAGSSDLCLSADASAGPMTLRLRFAVSVAAGTLDPAMLKGVLESESMNLVREMRERATGVQARATTRQREVDLDPDYEDWIQEVVEPAAAAVRDRETRSDRMPFSRPEADRKRPARAQQMVPVEWVYALAAALVMVVVGLGSLVGVQLREIGRLERPRLDIPTKEIQLNDEQRNVARLRLPGDTSHILLYLTIDETESCESYALELLDLEGRNLWSQSELSGTPVDELNLMLTRDVLSKAPLKIRLEGICGGAHKLIDEQEIAVELE